MRSPNNSLFILAVLAMAAAPQALLAQGRSAAKLRDPGNVRDGIGFGQSGTFSQYSYGVGSVSRSYRAPETDLLRSNIGAANNYKINAGTFDPSKPTDLSKLLAPPSGVYTKRPPAYDASKIGDTGGAGSLRTMLRGLRTNKVDATAAYASVLGNQPASGPSTDEPITSLVPSEPSMYRLFMERGETAFKAGEFHRAFGEFQLANDIGGNDWMSLVSMMHAKFAMSADSYYATAHYARLAVKTCPDLALVPLRPREFYRDKGKYSDGIVRLENRVDGSPHDPDAPFVLAYFRWFEGNPAAARKALSQALAAASGAGFADKVEACETFWRAMVSSGLASGVLTPASLPARPELDFPTPQTQPASASGPSTEPVPQ